jgi:hypothetical protein
MRIRDVVVLALFAAASSTAIACKSNKGSAPDPELGGTHPPPPPLVDGAPPDAMSAVDIPIPDTPAPDTPARRLWTPEIRDDATFEAYSKELGGERFTKFVVDLKTDAIYYFDVDVYRVHKDFVFAELYKKPRTPEAVREFDKNYHADKPEFLLCYLVHHLASDKWTFAFWEGDKMTAEHVRHAYARMKATFYLASLVKFRPDSDRQEKVALELSGIPVLTNDQLYKDAEYQMFNPGLAIGTLRLVPAGADFAELTFKPDEIVILPESLPDITPVAGILSETFSTPLSHVSLRARAWGIPNVGLKTAGTKFADLVGKTVYFEATAAKATLREATAEESAAWQKQAAADRAVVIPKADLATRDLRTLDALRAADATAYGTKAANLGEIVHGKQEAVVAAAPSPLDAFSVPPGFGVPITYYDAHLRAAKLDKTIEELLADPKFASDAAYRKQKLADLRTAIIAAPLDPVLAGELATAVDGITGGDAGKGVFVRSSTNAEDLPGFNGAGLYDTVPNVKGADALAKALKTVWASVWNLRAYEEREFFHIDHLRVYGAVLVQVGVNATAAGVLITAHPTDPHEKTTFQINAKSGLGMRVVEGKKVPESLLYDFHNDGLRVLSRSDEDTMLVFDDDGGVREVPNPKRGQPILTNKRARLLGRSARAIIKLFPRDRPLDIEWLFEGDTLYIVQARPYVVK